MMSLIFSGDILALKENLPSMFLKETCRETNVTTDGLLL